MDSGFPVDFSLTRTPASTSWPWFTGARLTGTKYLLTYDTSAEQTAGDWVWDNNEGWMKGGNGNTVQSWMWKRHAGFDIVTYKGNGNNTDGANAHAHSLGKAPEMIWIKTRSGGSYSGVTHWTMSHKGLNGGTNPWQYTMSINLTNTEATTSNFGNTAPTSTHFYVGDPGNGRSNGNNSNYLAMLFASVDGISKVGYYNGSDSEQTITTGFQPRFLIIKNATTVEDWMVFDSINGNWGSGNDTYLKLNTNDSSFTNYDYGAPTSTGFTLTGNNSGHNNAGDKYIYYAHA